MNKKSLIILTIEIISIIILYIFINSEYIKLIPECWIHKNTGLLCPSCGGTRCVAYIMKGDFASAFFSNMVFFIGIVYLFITNIVYIINLNRNKKILTWIYPKYWYSIVFAIILVMYTILRNVL